MALQVDFEDCCDFLNGDSLLGVLPKHALQHLFERITQRIAADFQLLVEDFFIQLLDGVSLKRDFSSQGNECQNPQTPHVCLKSFVSLLFDDFGSQVGRSAYVFEDSFPHLHFPADSEVAHLDLVLVVEENVVEFDVSVEDLLFVQISETFQDSGEYGEKLRFRELVFLLQDLQEVPLLSVLQDNEQILAVLEDLVELDDILMTAVLQDLDFLENPVQFRHVLYFRLFVELDGHLDLTDYGSGQKHLSVRALS